MITQIKKRNAYELIILLVFAIEVLMLIASNISQIKCHIGYDCSYFFNKAIEIWNQKTIFLENWSDQTALNFDTPIIMASLLYGLTNNIFLAYGISNIICNILLIVILYKVLGLFDVETYIRLMVISVLICPFLNFDFSNANDLGYYSMLLGNCQAYGFRIIEALFDIYIVINISRGTINKKQCMVSFVIAILTGISSGLYLIITVVLPIILFFLIKSFIEEKIEKKVLVYLLILAAAVLGGKLLQGLFSFEGRDEMINLLEAGDFFNNIGQIINGIIILLGALPLGTGISVTSLNGIMCLSRLLLLMLLAISLCYYIKGRNQIEKALDVKFLPIFIVLINIMMYMVGKFTYGSQYFTVRYLIVDFIFLMITIGIRLHEKEHSYIKKIVIMGFVAISLVNTVYSYYIYNENKINTEQYEEISTIINENDSPLVFCSSNLFIEGRNLDVFLDNKVVKVVELQDDGHFAQQLWGCSTAFSENADYTGENYLICQKEEYDIYPSYIKNKYELVNEYAEYNLYYSSENVFDFNTRIDGGRPVVLFPYSDNIVMQNGSYSESESIWTSDGTEGFIMYGPYSEWKSGDYNVKLIYKVDESIENSVGRFEIASDGGQKIIAFCDIPSNQGEIELGVSLGSDLSDYEIRCFEKDGTVIEIEKIIIQKK